MSLSSRILDLVFVEESWPASNQQLDGFDAGVLQSVPLSAWNVDGVAGSNFVLLAPDRHHSVTRHDVINLLELLMMVRRDSMARRKHLLGEATLSDSRRGPIYQGSDFGAVSGIDDLSAFAVYDDHESVVSG